MSYPVNDQVEEAVFENGVDYGYEECMKEWLGFLRTEYSKLENIYLELPNDSDLSVACYNRMEGIKHMIRERWHVELDVKDVVDGK